MHPRSLLTLTLAAFLVAPAHAQTAPPPAVDVTIAMAPPPDKPHINPPYLVGVHPGTPFLWRVPATGLRPLQFSAKGLPRGLTLDASTGIVTGKIMRAGDYAVQVQARGKAGQDTQTVHIVAGPRLALTPPMGWNSYDCFGDSVTEAETLANAAYVSQNMQPYGWDTVVVDYRWYDPGAHDNNANARAGAELAMDANGRLLPAPNRFPSAADGKGFAALAAQVHAMGLKFGIHIMRGIPRLAVARKLPILGTNFTAADAADTSDLCPWCADMYGVRGATPAGRAYYNSLFALYASWGVDYIKMDDTSRPYHTDEIEAVHDAIEHCGRSIVYSLSPGETPVTDAPHVQTHANLWRVSDDFWDRWQPLNKEFDYAMRWQSVVGQGHWPDADMLPLGHLSIANRSVRRDRHSQLTHTEQVTLLTLWSLLPSPLMVGANLPDNDPWTQSLLTNPDVLAVSQDSLGQAAVRVSADGSTEIWARPLADGSQAVGLFNRGSVPATMTVSVPELHITGASQARDLWQHTDLGPIGALAGVVVPPHGAVLLRLSHGKG